jgi:pyruvate formate lyase activating enzyme
MNNDLREDLTLVGNIQRFSIHDGAGVRTTVFLKGCPLKCYWCANPENQSYEQELMYFQERCAKCARCVSACPKHALSISEDKPLNLERAKCTICLSCSNACIENALRPAGSPYSAEEAFANILKDRAFYRTAGGVTLSGGEPLSFPWFCMDFAQLCKEHGINLIFETCGYGEWNVLREYSQYAQSIFFDVKHSDDGKHKDATGVSNKIIMDNFSKLTDVFDGVIVRVPVVPGFNDTHREMLGIVDLIKHRIGRKGIQYVELLPFHNLGAQKYIALGKEYILENEKNATKEQAQKLLANFIAKGINAVVK